MLLQHELAEGIHGVLLTGSNQCLYVRCLVILVNLGRYKAVFKLQMIHYQAGHPAIAISPWMDGHQFVVCIEA